MGRKSGTMAKTSSANSDGSCRGQQPPSKPPVSEGTKSDLPQAWLHRDVSHPEVLHKFVL